MTLLERLLGKKSKLSSNEASDIEAPTRVGVTRLSDTPEGIYRSLMNMLVTRPLDTDLVGPPHVRNKVADAYAHLLAAEQLLREWREANRHE